MSCFYYWLPAAKQPTNSAAIIKSLRESGLGYAIDSRITSRTSDRGPDGQRGVVVCAGDNVEGRLGWWPDEQTWKRIPGTELWCGMFTADRPKPDDLARTELVTGEWLTFDDGSTWMVPKARRWVEHEGKLLWVMNLPQCLTLDEDGQWVQGGIKAKYQRLWELATAYESTADTDGVYRFTLSQLNELAISTLQVNYRIGPVEIDLLGVFDETIRHRIIDVLLDVATVVEWSKKNEQALAGGSS
jgi:hypothetical protein